MKNYDVVVIGGGPAGLSASLEASKNNAKVLLIEREEKLGGILKQCIHNGFGLITFKEQLSGPEYVERFIDLLNKSNVEVLLSTFVLSITNVNGKYKIAISNQKGTEEFYTNSLIFSTGCRERSAKQVFMMGDRVAGVMTAGLAQYYVNILGQKIGKNVVILGSGDIGLIMARRLTLEGAKVLGVYEIKSNPSGLNRNVEQCLKDFNIPLHLSTTVTKTFGKDRLEAIEVCQVDDHMNQIESTREVIKCDTLILSVGLIPENELLEKLGVKIDRCTNGAIVDGSLMTNVDNVYACGNCLHVHDLVDYVSESSVIAGRNASKKLDHERVLVNINKGNDIFYVVPQTIDIKNDNSKTNIYFRVKSKFDKKKVVLLDKDNNEIYSKNLIYLNPAEMIKLEVNLKDIKDDIKIDLI